MSDDYIYHLIARAASSASKDEAFQDKNELISPHSMAQAFGGFSNSSFSGPVDSSDLRVPAYMWYTCIHSGRHSCI